MGQIMLEPVTEAEAGLRVDQFLARRFAHMSGAKAKQEAQKEHVWVNGVIAKKGVRLSIGDQVSLARLPEATEFDVRPDPKQELVVAYEDDWMVVVDKAAGVPCHPLRDGETGTVANGLVARYPEMNCVGYGPREPGLVHRIDVQTSGLVLAARDAETFSFLTNELKRGAIDKRYLAICVGMVKAPQRIELPIDARGGKRVRVISTEAASPHAKEAITEVLTACPVPRGHGIEEGSVIEARAHFARRHQIRVHLAAIGHPLLGDAQYGGPPWPGQSRHALHASRLSFEHPRLRVAVEVVSPRPSEFGRAGI